MQISRVSSTALYTLEVPHCLKMFFLREKLTSLHDGT